MDFDQGLVVPSASVCKRCTTSHPGSLPPTPHRQRRAKKVHLPEGEDRLIERFEAITGLGPRGSYPHAINYFQHHSFGEASQR